MFEQFLQQEYKRLNLPGLAVAITKSSQEIFACGIGHCDLLCNEPITPDTLFGVASITKLLTTIEILRLSEQGYLQLDDPLVQQYPQLLVAQQSTMQLRHLLSHSAGLRGLDTRFKATDVTQVNKVPRNAQQSTNTNKSEELNDLANPMINANDLVDYLNSLDLKLLAKPGQLLNYSNEGFCLLGGIIEKIRSMPYVRAISSDILQPLGLNRSVIGGNTLASLDNIAYPLIRDCDSYLQGRHWEAPLFYPAGGLVASARELAQLINDVFSTRRLLSANNQRLLSSNVISVPSRPYDGVGYGLGLEYRRFDADNTVLWHTGQRPGVSSFVGWHIEQEIAVSVLSHVANAAVAGVGFELFGKLLSRHDYHWPPRPASDATIDKQKSIVTGVAGRYSSMEGFNYDIVADANGYKLYSNHLVDPEREQQATRFNFHDERSGIVGEHTFQFLSGALFQQNTTDFDYTLALDLRVLTREN